MSLSYLWYLYWDIASNYIPIMHIAITVLFFMSKLPFFSPLNRVRDGEHWGCFHLSTCSSTCYHCNLSIRLLRTKAYFSLADYIRKFNLICKPRYFICLRNVLIICITVCQIMFVCCDSWRSIQFAMCLSKHLIHLLIMLEFYNEKMAHDDSY